MKQVKSWRSQFFDPLATSQDNLISSENLSLCFDTEFLFVFPDWFNSSVFHDSHILALSLQKLFELTDVLRCINNPSLLVDNWRVLAVNQRCLPPFEVLLVLLECLTYFDCLWWWLLGYFPETLVTLLVVRKVYELVRMNELWT